MPAKTIIDGFSVQELAEITCGQLVNSERASFRGVSTDTRTIRPGDCFFAIEGINFDGHNYLSEAFDKGAACAVISKEVPISVSAASDRGAILKVSDTVKALGDFAAWYRREMDFKLVAVTGSAGKTTTRKIIHHVLSGRFRVHQSPKNFNNFIGLPLTILSAGAEDEIVVAEIGANRPGEIAYLSNIASPDIAVITNVHPAHLEGLGCLEGIIREKISIHQGLREGGRMFINADFRQLVSACDQLNIGYVRFGSKAGSEITAQEISLSADSADFILENEEIHLPLVGRGNLENALAGWAVCREFGVSSREFAAAARTFTCADMRTELQNAGSLLVLNDCYNANPASMKNALEILGRIGEEKKRRLVFICGDMTELGAQGPEFHKQLGTLIAESDIALLLTVGEYSRIAAESAKRRRESLSREHSSPGLSTKSFCETSSLCDNLEFCIRNNDIILVKASRTLGLEKAVEKLKELFE